MEPLINFRLSASKLTTDETNRFINKIMQIFGAEQIVSSISNDFGHQYRKNHAHNTRLQPMIDMMTKIINSRKKNEDQPSQDSPNNDSLPFTMENMAPQLIGHCASFLEADDYMNLSIANRTIYCAANSPNTLRELDLRKQENYDEIDLNRFVLLKALAICPNELNKFRLSLYPKCNNFSHLVELHIDNEANVDADSIMAFIDSNIIPLGQITKLKLSNFGYMDDDEDDHCFDSVLFCKLLSYFPNVIHLELASIHLLNFGDGNEFIHPECKILSKLTSLDCLYLGPNDSANWLRDKLMETFSKQIECIGYNEDFVEISTYSFPNLRQLKLFNGEDDSLKKMIDANNSLDHVDLGLIDESNTIKQSIIKLLSKTPAINAIALVYSGKNIQSIMSFLEMGLHKSRNMDRNSLCMHLILRAKISMETFELCINRIVNALDATQTKNWRFVFYFSKDMDESNYRHRICDNLKTSYLVAVTDEADGDDELRIVVSNKTCNICVYQAGILNY